LAKGDNEPLDIKEYSFDDSWRFNEINLYTLEVRVLIEIFLTSL